MSVLNNLINALLDEYQYTTSRARRRWRSATGCGWTTRTAGGGTGGKVYQYMGTAATRNLGTQDYTDYGFWKELSPTSLMPTELNISDSDATADRRAGGAERREERRRVVREPRDDQRGGALDHGNGARGDQLGGRQCGERVGRHRVGGGTVLAVNATIATNTVLSQANAYLDDVDVTHRAAAR